MEAYNIEYTCATEDVCGLQRQYSQSVQRMKARMYLEDSSDHLLELLCTCFGLPTKHQVVVGDILVQDLVCNAGVPSLPDLVEGSGCCMQLFGVLC